MNIHEYQAKELFRKFGVAVPDGHVAYTPAEAEEAAGKMPGPVWVVKSQIHAGGRGAGRFKDDPDGCASHFADGADAPTGCKLASFTTFDLVARWKPLPELEVYGSVQNLFDKVAPLDPLTYGAQAYNPLDYEGARGRYFTVGARYTF